MSIYEAVGIGYVIIGTAAFTVQVIYCAAKGLGYIQRLIQRAHGFDDTEHGGDDTERRQRLGHRHQRMVGRQLALHDGMNLLIHQRKFGGIESIPGRCGDRSRESQASQKRDT